MNNRKPSHLRPAALGEFLYGVAYYPEHWDAAVRQNDPEWMAAAGMNVVRMAEFAWDVIEPEEGTFDFTLFDREIARLGAQGIRTIMCTPTATPPRWFTHRHPESLRMDADFVPQSHGSRQHCCQSSSIFREYSQKITRAMAAHYARNEHVIGWQTDNEFNCHFSECHCQNCQRAFAQFLRERYGDVAALNRAWGTAFWAQTYRSFDEVLTPRHKPAYPNPAHMLDYFRYISWSVAAFQAEQVAILRAARPEWFVTHNRAGQHIDYRGKFVADLDFLGWDVYPFFCDDRGMRSRHQVYNCDRTRALSGNFIIPEQQSGPGGQGHYMHETPEPGEMRRMTYLSLARGADSVLYFRWRTCRFGAEEYWCGVVEHDNVRRRRYREAAQVGRELKTIGPQLLGTSVFADVAVATGDIDVSDGHTIMHHGLPGPENIGGEVFDALLCDGYAVGAVHPGDVLDGLKGYVIPHWAMFDPAWVPALDKFVRRGGVLLIGARTGIKDMNNNVIGDTPPGALAELAGVTVDEYGRIRDREKWGHLLEFDGRTVAPEHWYEALAPADGTDVVATWRTRHLDGLPAVTARKVGAGTVIYAGTFLTREVFGMLKPLFVEKAGLARLHPDANGEVIFTKRFTPDKTLWFIVNTLDTGKTVTAPPEGKNLITGEDVSGKLELGPHDVAVVRER